MKTRQEKIGSLVKHSTLEGGSVSNDESLYHYMIAHECTSDACQDVDHRYCGELPFYYHFGEGGLNYNVGTEGRDEQVGEDSWEDCDDEYIDFLFSKLESQYKGNVIT